MDRKTYENQKAFAGSLQPSMKRRAVDHDYHQRRIYMITLVVECRRPLLGELRGSLLAAPDSADVPQVALSSLGEAVSAVWRSIPQHHPGVDVLALQIMPDHLHGILFVKQYLEEGLGKVILGFKQACNKEYRRLGCQGPVSAIAVESVAVPRQQTPPQQTPQPAPRHTGHEAGLLFERGYNDRILLRDGQLERMKAYLADNPRRLMLKREHPDLLRVRTAVDVCGLVCSAVGNLALLTVPRRLQVRISRSIDPALLETEKSRLLAAAREGAVLVSPAISPGEKAVMRAAFDEGLPLIVLLDNGLSPLSKPSGERFYACAAGRLLLISPFPHPTTAFPSPARSATPSTPWPGTSPAL